MHLMDDQAGISTRISTWCAVETKKPLSINYLRAVFGASGENRTPTLLPTADFESAASTNSATEAWRESIEMHSLLVKCFFMVILDGFR